MFYVTKLKAHNAVFRLCYISLEDVHIKKRQKLPALSRR